MILECVETLRDYKLILGEKVLGEDGGRLVGTAEENVGVHYLTHFHSAELDVWRRR